MTFFDLSYLFTTGRPLQAIALLAVAATAAIRFLARRAAPNRLSTFSKPGEKENVLIVGASSGVGQAVALRYARTRSADVQLGLVARRPCQHVVSECEQAGSVAWSFQADASNPEDIVRLLQQAAKHWEKIDTVVICAGVLTTQPVLALSRQVSPEAPTRLEQDPSLESLRHLSNIAQQSYSANVVSSLLLISASIPLLAKSSSPRICVLSSVAAEIPAPTRAIYGANKAALSMLLRSWRIELEDLITEHGRKRIGLTIVHPASINTGLRASAIDTQSSSSMEDDGLDREKHKAMSSQHVAEQVITAVDLGQDEIWLPTHYWWISKVVQIIFPGVVKTGAKKKYNFA